MTEFTKPKPKHPHANVPNDGANKDKFFTRMDFKTALKLDFSVDNRYLAALVAYGYAIVEENEAGYRWKLIKDVGNEAPRFSADGVLITESGANEAMWRAIRILKHFTCDELFAHVAKYTTASNVKSYVRHLHQAGYLRQEKKGIEAANYHLVQNTGHNRRRF